MADIAELTASTLAAAREHPHGRYAELVAHDGELRQTLLALASGAQLGEHNSPPAATIYVLVGRVRVMVAGNIQADISAGELWVLTHERHGVEAVADSVFLLTTVTSVTGGSHGEPD